jgi:hypothetical protein
MFCLHYPRIPLAWAIIAQYRLDSSSWESSVSIMSDYGLDDWVIRVRSTAGAEDFSSGLCVQTGSGAHPASCPKGTGCPFPGGKVWPGRAAYHSPLSSAEVMNELELYLVSSQASPWCVMGLLYFMGWTAGIFLFATRSREAVGFTQSPIQWAANIHFPWG